MEILWRVLCAFLLVGLQYGLLVESAINLDTGNTASVKDVARKLADSAMKYYDGDKPGSTPGLLPAAGEFNWWEAGALFGQMVEYWYYTGDDRYNNATKQALIFQAGDHFNYEPENQTRTEGNDDQAFWAFAAMSAAELKFPSPGPKDPSWLSLAQAVFNRQAGRWDDKHCSGGLRWQFNPLNNGWMNKNTISNGCFFQLAARLARYTKNDTYATWAEKSYDWMTKSPLISKDFEVFDSIGFSEDKCDDTPGPIQWSYNIGTIIAGCAIMYNHTNGAQVWKDRLQGYLNHAQSVFFPSKDGGKIMVEYACESVENCNKDQRSFKAYLSRWIALTAQTAPFTSGQIMPWIQGSSQGAAKACVQSGDDISCGRKWNIGKDDGERDIGNQMTALGIIQANLVLKSPGLADIKTGISKSDPNAGSGSKDSPINYEATRIITAGDKAGAWILTVFAVAGSIAGVFALLLDGGDLKEYTGFAGGRHSRGNSY